MLTPKTALRRDPRVQAVQPARIQAVEAALRLDPVTHQPGLPQHLQMLGNRRPAAAEVRRHLPGGQLILGQQLHDASPGRIGQGRENLHTNHYVSFDLIKSKLTYGSSDIPVAPHNVISVP